MYGQDATEIVWNAQGMSGPADSTVITSFTTSD